MNTKRVLITHDRNGAAAFRKEVAETADAATQLIQAYEAFQPWNKVKTIQDFIELVSDPKKAYDAAIIANIAITAKGMTVDPAQAARLFNLHRDEYLNLVDGMPLTSDDCAPCRKVRVKPGRRAISKHTFESYQEYLTFTGTQFVVNETAVEAAMSQFDVYATTEQERGVVNDFTQLVETLNQWDKKYYIPDNAKEQLKKTFGLYLSQGSSGHFMMNPEAVIKSIQKLKNSNDGRN